MSMFKLVFTPSLGGRGHPTTTVVDIGDHLVVTGVGVEDDPSLLRLREVVRAERK